MKKKNIFNESKEFQHFSETVKAAQTELLLPQNAACLSALEGLTVRALILRGAQLVSAYVNRVQRAVILLSVVKFALVNGAFNGFVNLIHVNTSFCTLLYVISMAEIHRIIDGFQSFTP